MPWTDEFQRLVLAAAVQGAVWIDPSLGSWTLVFTSDLGQSVVSPYTHIATALDAVIAQTALPARPSLAVVEQEVRTRVRALREDARTAVLTCLEQVRVWPVTDAAYLESAIHLRLTRQRLARVLTQSVDEIEREQDDHALTRIYTLFEDALRARPSAVALASTLVPHLARTESRKAWWAADPDAGRIPTGFAALDTILSGGVRRGEVFYLLAPPKGHKTNWLINIGFNAVRAHRSVLFISYEMSTHAMQLRFDRHLARATREQLRQDPSLLDVVRGWRAIGAGEMWLAESVPGQTDAASSASRLIRLLRQRGDPVDVVVFDYLNIMGPSDSSDREKRHQLARVSREMAALARGEDVVVWSAALAKREAVDRLKVRKIDIMESFEVIAVADGVLALCGDEAMRESGIRRLYCVALRDAEDDIYAGTYRTDGARMLITPAHDAPTNGASGASS